MYRALTRPLLVLGGERELMLSTALMAGFLVIVIKTWASVIAGALLWLIAAAALVKLANYDAQLSKVYLRHLRYQAYYPGRSSGWGQCRARWP